MKQVNMRNNFYEDRIEVDLHTKMKYIVCIKLPKTLAKYKHVHVFCQRLNSNLLNTCTSIKPYRCNMCFVKQV